MTVDDPFLTIPIVASDIQSADVFSHAWKDELWNEEEIKWSLLDDISALDISGAKLSAERGQGHSSTNISSLPGNSSEGSPPISDTAIAPSSDDASGPAVADSSLVTPEHTSVYYRYPGSAHHEAVPATSSSTLSALDNHPEATPPNHPDRAHLTANKADKRWRRLKGDSSVLQERLEATRAAHRAEIERLRSKLKAQEVQLGAAKLEHVGCAAVRELLAKTQREVFVRDEALRNAKQDTFTLRVELDGLKRARDEALKQFTERKGELTQHLHEAEERCVRTAESLDVERRLTAMMTEQQAVINGRISDKDIEIQVLKAMLRGRDIQLGHKAQTFETQEHAHFQELDFERTRAEHLQVLCDEKEELIDGQCVEIEELRRLLDERESNKPSGLDDERQQDERQRDLELANMRNSLLEIQVAEMREREERFQEERKQAEERQRNTQKQTQRILDIQSAQIEELERTIVELKKRMAQDRRGRFKKTRFADEETEAEGRRGGEAPEQNQQETEENQRWRRATDLERQRCFERDRKWPYVNWGPSRAIARFRIVSAEFLEASFSKDKPLTTRAIPWPIPSHPDKISLNNIQWVHVEQFFQLAKVWLQPKDYNDLVEQTQRMFHPDRWTARQILETVMDESRRSKIQNAGNVVAQAVTAIRSQSRNN